MSSWNKEEWLEDRYQYYLDEGLSEEDAAKKAQKDLDDGCEDYGYRSKPSTNPHWKIKYQEVQ